MPRLLLLTAAELTRDPRARRAAAAARARRLEVVGLCGQISGEAPFPLEGVSVVRVGPAGRTDAAWESGLEPRRREPALLREGRGIYRLGRLLARTLALTRAGRRFGAVDIVHANDLDTLPAGALLARAGRARLVYDAHELYAEFDEDPPRLYRALATRLEGVLARRAAAVVTVSDALAAELEARLRLPRRPEVVLNAPPLDTREPKAAAARRPLLAVYHGSFGPGRPVADLLDAVRLAPHVRLTVRALHIDPALLREEVATRGLDGRVEIAAPLPPDAVADGLRAHDVGLVFDHPVTRNCELSLPNKLFEYLMAGLAVVASRLPGLVPLVEGEGVGVTFDPGRPESLAARLEELAADRARLARLRRRAREVAVERYNAEAQADALARAWGLG